MCYVFLILRLLQIKSVSRISCPHFAADGTRSFNLRMLDKRVALVRLRGGPLIIQGGRGAKISGWIFYFFLVYWLDFFLFFTAMDGFFIILQWFGWIFFF